MKRTILSFVALFSCMMMQAADVVWCVVTQSGQAVPVSAVSYILNLGADSETFNIVLKDGTVIQGITKATFSRMEPTAISSVGNSGSNAPETRIAGDEITLIGCPVKSHVEIYAVSGKRMKSVVTASSETSFSISDLPAGVYVLKVGSVSVKFLKK